MRESSPLSPPHLASSHLPPSSLPFPRRPLTPTVASLAHHLVDAKVPETRGIPSFIRSLFSPLSLFIDLLLSVQLPWRPPPLPFPPGVSLLQLRSASLHWRASFVPQSPKQAPAASLDASVNCLFVLEFISLDLTGKTIRRKEPQSDRRCRLGRLIEFIHSHRIPADSNRKQQHDFYWFFIFRVNRPASFLHL